MRKVLPIILLCLFFITPSFANDISNLEARVVKRAQSDPDTAYEYFLEQIEAGATPEEQAVYLYGMGLVNEAKGKVDEAVNDYMASEILGNESASRVLIKLRKNKKEGQQP